MGLMLVGNLVDSAAGAVKAAKDGANYVVLQVRGSLRRRWRLVVGGPLLNVLQG